MFRAGSVNVARAVASNSKRAAFTTSAARNAPIRVGINGFGRIGRLVSQPPVVSRTPRASAYASLVDVHIFL